MEIKFPFTIKEHPDTLRSKVRSFLNEYDLIKTHKYFTQIQGQLSLLVTEKAYCDFVVWIPKGQVIQRFYTDISFTEKLLQKLTNISFRN